MSLIRRSILALSLLVQAIYLPAQPYTIRVLDQSTGAALPFVHVCFEGLNGGPLSYCITDRQGKAVNEVSERSQVALSCVGYKTLIDTIDPANSYTYHLLPSSFELDEIVITGQFSPVRADQSIYKVQVINRKEIQDRSAANLAELLKTKLNFRTYQDAALGSGISIQGLTGEHVKVLVDGVPVTGRMNGHIDLNQVSLFNADHVEVVEGPMSVIYGSNALAGAINVITREHPREKLRTALNAYYESAGVYNLDASGGYRSGKHQVSISGARNFFAGFADPDTARTKQWKPKLQYSLDGFYIYRNGNLKLKADIRLFDETVQSKGPVVPLPPTYAKAFDTYFFTGRYSYRGQANYSFRGHGSLEMMASHSVYNRYKNTYTKDLTTLEQELTPDPEFQDSTTFRAKLFRATYSGRIAGTGTLIQAGADLNQEAGTGKRIRDEYQQTGDYAGFISLKQGFGNLLEIQAGARYGYNTRFITPFIPSLNIRVTPVQGMVLRASFARGFRAPSLKELYLYFVDINHNICGNENLEPEFSTNLTASAGYQFDTDKRQYFTEAEIFHNDIRNNINLAIDPAGTYSYVNIDRYRTLGGSLHFRYKLHPRFSTQLGYILVGRKSYKTGSESTPFFFYQDLVAEMNYRQISKNLGISVYFKVNGRQPQYYINGEDELVEGFIDSYELLDLTISRSFMNERLQLSLGVKNLLNVRNIKASSLFTGAHTSGSGIYPAGYGRTAFLRLSYTFAKYDQDR